MVDAERDPIDESVRLERRMLWGTVDHDEFSQRGWVPKTDEARCGQGSVLDERGGQRQGSGVS